MITVGITRIPSTSEYRVFWKDGNRYSEARSGYTDDPEDAVNTLLSTYQTAKERGFNIKITNADFTKGLINRYRPSFTTVDREPTIQGEVVPPPESQEVSPPPPIRRSEVPSVKPTLPRFGPSTFGSTQPY